MTTRRNEPWSAEENRRFRKEIADGAKLTDIARVHQRSRIAIAAQAHKLRLKVNA